MDGGGLEAAEGPSALPGSGTYASRRRGITPRDHAERSRCHAEIRRRDHAERSSQDHAEITHLGLYEDDVHVLDRSRREVDPRAAVHVPRVAAGGIDAWVVLQMRVKR